MNPLPPKKEVALALLERGSVHVHLDPRASGVVVPAWFKRQPQLVLQVGLNMPVPIPDLRVDEDGMSCTLSFNRSPFFCIVPWSSVYAMVGDDGRGMVWPEDVPPEVALQGRAQDTATKKPATERPLAVVKSVPQTAAKAGKAARPTEGATAKEKKPRAKKPRGVDAPGKTSAPSEGRANGKGVVLVSIPAAGAASQAPEVAKKPRRGSPPVPIVPPPQAAASPRLHVPPPAATAPPPAPAAAPASAGNPAPTGPTLTGPALTGKRGKSKREIPPYLRVVK